MLQGVVLEQDGLLPEAELSFDDITLVDNDSLMSEIEKVAQGDENLEFSNGLLRVKKAGYSVSIPIEKKSEGEIYLQFRNMHYRSMNFYSEQAEQLKQEGAERMSVISAQRASRQWQPISTTTVTASMGQLSDFAILMGQGFNYYFGPRDLLLNLGYGESRKKLKITFSQAGEYSFDDASIICQPMETYPEKVAPLKARQAESVDVDGNTVTVRFDLDESAFACLAIPYTDSWSATVDGEKAEILPANGMYMGVMLDAGRHTIVFHYTMRGFREGAAVSLATLIGLVVFGVVRRLRRYGR